MKRAHPMPFGAELAGDVVRFALWAPSAREVALELDGRVQGMTSDSGWFRATLEARRDTLAGRLGTFVIHVEPEDCVITIGERPVEAGVPMRLTPGDYEVRVTRAGYRRALETHTAAPGRTEEITIRLVRAEEAAFLDVQTDPPNADLYIDGEAYGLTPRNGLALSMGGHVLRIELDRYDTVTREITLEAHEHQTLEIGQTVTLGDAVVDNIVMNKPVTNLGYPIKCNGKSVF